MLILVLPPPRPEYGETRQSQILALANRLSSWIDSMFWAQGLTAAEDRKHDYPPSLKDNGNYRLDSSNNWWLNPNHEGRENEVWIQHRYTTTEYLEALAAMFGGYKNVTLTP